MQIRTLLATTAATAAVSLLPISAQAATLFGTGGIQFDQDTTIRFTFEGASHFYQSNLSLYVVNPTSGFVDISSAVPLFGESPGAFQDVNFVAGRWYTLGLSNINPNNGTPGLSPSVFSTTLSNNAPYLDPNGNPGPYQQAIFGSFGSPIEGVAFNPTGFQSGNPFAGPVQISFEDGGWNGSFDSLGRPIYTANGRNDRDFNDFRFTAQAIPAPPLLLGLLALGARVFSRQRKSVRA